MTDDLFWPNRRIDTGFETAEALASCYNRDNWRAHPEAQRLATEDSLDTLGLIGQIKKSTITGLMFDGHLRVELALLKNPQMLLPVDYYDLNEDETALALQVHDAITEQAQPIPEKLAALMERTREITADRPGLRAMLDALKEKAGVNGNGHEPEPSPPPVDKAEELQAKWQVKSGDIWQIDRHFVICGDCREPETWQRLMDKNRATLCVTSPPYWVGREYERETGKDEIKTHIAEVTKVIASVMDNLPHIAINTGTTTLTKQGGAIRQVWLLIDWWAEAFESYGIVLRNLRIWGKHGGFTTFSPSQDVVDQNWEFLASFTKSKPRPQNQIGERWALDGIWDCQPQTENIGHTAPFPLEIPSRYIQLYTKEDDIVFEPYLGSGTTLIAASQLNRRCYGIEIEPRYVAVVLERIQLLTQQQPRLLSG